MWLCVCCYVSLSLCVAMLLEILSLARPVTVENLNSEGRLEKGFASWALVPLQHTVSSAMDVHE